jgi:hypothetical protein
MRRGAERRLQERYPEYYFNEIPFNTEAMDPSTYVIVGRRGSGKTSLAQYFKFQTLLANARCIDVDEPQEYEWVLSKLAERAAYSSPAAIPRIVKIWNLMVWSLLFQAYRDDDSRIGAACLPGAQTTNPAQLILSILRQLLNRCATPGSAPASTNRSLCTRSPTIPSLSMSGNRAGGGSENAARQR